MKYTILGRPLGVREWEVLESFDNEHQALDAVDARENEPHTPGWQFRIEERW